MKDGVLNNKDQKKGTPNNIDHNDEASLEAACFHGQARVPPTYHALADDAHGSQHDDFYHWQRGREEQAGDCHSCGCPPLALPHGS